QERKRADHDVPRRSEQERRDRPVPPLVQGLEELRAPPAVIDARPAEAGAQASVQATRPASMATRAVFVGPLSLEQRLRPSVASLLAPVGANGGPGLMPDESGRVEAKLVPGSA